MLDCKIYLNDRESTVCDPYRDDQESTRTPSCQWRQVCLHASSLVLRYNSNQQTANANTCTSSNATAQSLYPVPYDRIRPVKAVEKATSSAPQETFLAYLRAVTMHLLVTHIQQNAVVQAVHSNEQSHLMGTCRSQ